MNIHEDDIYDLYAERLSIRIVDGKESEAWALREMRKEIIQHMRDLGVPLASLPRWANIMEARAKKEGIV